MVLGPMICISMLNFVEIDQSTAKILRLFDFGIAAVGRARLRWMLLTLQH